ncbi:MAG TPA: ABC transporter permease [Nitrospiria bacterium]|nr:ABC transporter permease [Nitrospiria bacterium]
MLRRIREILKKEFIQMLRDKRMRFVLIGPPLIQLIVFGYAANFDIHHIRVGVYDLDQSSVSRDLLARFERSGYFDVTRWVADEDEIAPLLDRRDVTAVIQINHGFAADLKSMKTAQVQLILDGTDSNTASVVLAYANAIVGDFAEYELQNRLLHVDAALAAYRPDVAIEQRAWFNPNLESRPYFVPGIIATLVLIVTMSLTSMAVVREREVGTLEQLMVTPIRPLELIIGKTVPFAVVGLLDATLIAVLGVVWFDVPMNGDPLVLLLGAVLYLLSTLGMGLFLSTISSTQQESMLVSFFFIMPVMLLSGFTFPIASMPEWIQYLTYLNPLRYFLIVIRGVFLRGSGVVDLWPQLAAMAALGTAMMVLSALRFKKRIE